MKEQNDCAFEPKVIKCLKNGIRDEEISTHLKLCAVCRETAKVFSFFQNNARLEFAPKNLPTAGLIWWKAKLRNKRMAAEKAAQPIFITQIIAIIVALVAVVGLLIYQPNFFAPLATVISRTFDTIRQIALPLFAGFIGFAFVFGLMVLTLRRLLSEK